MEQGTVRLVVQWDRQAARIVAAAADSRRPQAARLLAGRPLAEAVALAPRLFSLCAGAQAAAAQLAAAAASGRPAAADEALRLAVAREAVGEHLWRLLLDWPPLLGAAPAKADFLDWRRRLAAAATPADHVALGQALRDFVAGLVLPGPAELPETSTPADLRLLPWLDAAGWAGVAAGIDVGFAQAPTFAGAAAETGALARRQSEPAVAALLAAGRRLAARLAARRADLDFLARGLAEPALLDGWLGAAPVAAGVGIASVETARGLLLHLIQVKDGQVAGYVIVAPTEWNFHPQGAFAGELAGCPAATRGEAELQARCLALALDPCVNYEVVVEDA